MACFYLFKSTTHFSVYSENDQTTQIVCVIYR